MLVKFRNQLRNEEGAEAIVFLGLAILGLVLVGLLVKFVVPAFTDKAQQIGECIGDNGQSTTECG